MQSSGSKPAVNASHAGADKLPSALSELSRQKLQTVFSNIITTWAVWFRAERDHYQQLLTYCKMW